MKKVAFVGLGAMGLSMANNIIKGGYQVVGYDRDPSQLQLHAENGGLVADSPAEAARGADFVITMLPVGSIVSSALFDEGGISETISSDAIFIDMSTIHPLESDELRAKLGERGIKMIDAPVGRTAVEAVLGKLLILAGGEKETIEQARPILACMGESITDCGGPGKGIRIKIINNFMSITLNALTAECLSLSDKLGVDRDIAIEVMSGTAAIKSHILTTYPVKVFNNDLTSAFPIELANKDLMISLDLAKDLDTNMEMGKAARTIYQQAKDAGRGNQDWTALYAMLSPRYQTS